MFGYIYLTTNLVTGFKYIGQKTSSEFLGEAYLGSGKILKRAIDKYGKDNFKVELLEAVEGGKTDLDIREIYWISRLNAVDSHEFYNLHPGGRGGATYGHSGHSVTEEQRQHQSDLHKQRFIDNPELAVKISQINRERFSNPEERAKVSECVKKLWENQEYRERQSASHKGQESPMKGKKHSEETRKRISERGKGRTSPRKGVILSEEQRRAHSEAMKGRTWWTNGIQNKLVKDCPGEDWYLGRVNVLSY